MGDRASLEFVRQDFQCPLVLDDLQQFIKRLSGLAHHAQIAIELLWKLANVAGANLGIVEPFDDLADFQIT